MIDLSYNYSEQKIECVAGKCRLFLHVISGVMLSDAFMKILSGNESNTKISCT